MAYVFSDWKGELATHVFAGYCVALLIVFRIIWGFIGPLYSKFKHLPLHGDFTMRREIKRTKVFAGHNPNASLVLLGMLVMLVFIVLTGLFTFLEANGKLGVFAMGLDEEAFKSFHAFLVNFFIGLIVMHLLGVTLDFFTMKNQSALKSIFTGYKNIDATPAHLHVLQIWFTIAYYVCATVVAIILF
jgi:cytochrome b